MTVEIAQPEDTLGAQLAEVFRVLRKIGPSEHEELSIDLSSLSDVGPTLILPIASFLDGLKEKGCSIEWSSSPSMDSFLSFIHFPHGLEFDRESGRTVVADGEGSHTPMLRFSVGEVIQRIRTWNEFLSGINEQLASEAGLSDQGKCILSYLLSEMTDNILDHSITGNGWFFVKTCSKGAYIDLCIIDTGRGLLSSYRDSGIDGIEDDHAAIRAAIEGVSTKGKERGHGIPSTRRMIEEGLNEEFILFSGNALRIHGQFLEAPIAWQGTLLAFRIPTDTGNFDYLEYV